MHTITPQEYLQRTGASYQQMADAIGLEKDTVKRWFMRGKNRTNPSPVVCRALALSLEVAELKANGGRQNRDTVA